MVVYSIKDIENLSGIKAHTIRIWEKRYGILKAKRTETNIRYYTEEDLKYALNISLLYRAGIKISKIAKLEKAEVRNRVADLTEIDHSFEKNLDSLSLSMLELDEYKFTRILSRKIEQNGFDDTMENVLYPLLEKINLMWVAGSINEIHETFVLNIIMAKLAVETDKIESAKQTKKNSFLLFLPEKESQKLSLYYMLYLLKKEGFPAFFLGVDVGFEKLKLGIKTLEPEYVFTIINDAFTEEPLQPFIEKICAEIPGQFLLSGYQAISQDISPPKNCQVLGSLEQVLTFVEGIKEKHFVTNS